MGNIMTNEIINIFAGAFIGTGIAILLIMGSHLLWDKLRGI
jgi:hypothetical protein